MKGLTDIEYALLTAGTDETVRATPEEFYEVVKRGLIDIKESDCERGREYGVNELGKLAVRCSKQSLGI